MAADLATPTESQSASSKGEDLRHSKFITYLVLVILLIATFYLSDYTRSSMGQLAHVKFENETARIKTLIKDRIQSHLDNIYGIQGLYAANKIVSRDQWEVYLEKQELKKRYPDLSLISFIEPEGENFMVRYVTPSEGNEKRVGVNMGLEKGKRSALEKARDTGKPAATEYASGSLIFLPIFRYSEPTDTALERQSALVGFVNVAFSVEHLLAYVLRKEKIHPEMFFKLYDGNALTSEISDESLIFDNTKDRLDRFEAGRKDLAATALLEVGGRTWSLYFYAAPSFGLDLLQKSFPFFVLLAGLVFSFLLFWDLYSLVTARSRAVALAEKMTVDLRNEIAVRRKAEYELAERSKELARSNEELEKFAYVASHDLQEPLRTITSYTQLLEKRYQGKFDPDADEFFGFIVDGASRMRQLITDLLTYARVGSKPKSLEPTNCDTLLNSALSNLQAALHDSQGVVTYDPLPSVMADSTQLSQLFQNLIGNAIKFRGKEPPRVHISAKQQGGDWVFSVSDKGIGIEPEYVERIFIIFQRLHSRSEYSGTGIGLAVCKKIVERHGGRIWVESEPQKGSTFYFTLPAGAGIINS